MDHLPDIVLIGYQRAGSTFLRNYFTSHPDIAWTREASRLLYGKDEDEARESYLNRFQVPKDDRCLIDVCEGYSLGGIAETYAMDEAMFLEQNFSYADSATESDPLAAAQRLKKALPEAKILITIRNQEDWLRSNYLHFIGLMPKAGKKKFSVFLSSFEGKSELFAGLYHSIVNAYYELFGKENVHVMLLEQMVENQEKNIKKLCNFIGVKYVQFTPGPHDRNTGIGNAKGRLIQRMAAVDLNAFKLNRFRPILGPFEGRILSLFGGDVLSDDEKSLIRSFYSASNFNTSMLIGEDLKKYGYPV